MVLFNYSTKEITAKVVFYGPGLCGKTTNLQYIYDNLPKNIQRGRMLSLATKTDRTLFFDFLPIDLGTIRGMRTRVQLYTVPGQVFYNSTRKLVLKGADGIVFVADSQEKMAEANEESFHNLEENCVENGIVLAETPLVLQFNKRDLPGLSSIEDMNNLINKYNAPFYESVATTGIGVHETLKGITKLVLHSLQARYAGDTAGTRRSAGSTPGARTPSAPPASPQATVPFAPAPDLTGRESGPPPSPPVVAPPAAVSPTASFAPEPTPASQPTTASQASTAAAEPPVRPAPVRPEPVELGPDPAAPEAPFWDDAPAPSGPPRLEVPDELLVTPPPTVHGTLDSAGASRHSGSMETVDLQQEADAEPPVIEGLLRTADEGAFDDAEEASDVSPPPQPATAAVPLEEFDFPEPILEEEEEMPAPQETAGWIEPTEDLPAAASSPEPKPDATETFADLARELDAAGDIIPSPAAAPSAPSAFAVPPPAAPGALSREDPLGLGVSETEAETEPAAHRVVIEPGTEEVEIPLEVEVGDQSHRFSLRLRISVRQES